MLVLEEKRGACSTKHALLKVLADEIDLSLDLVIGIYPMNEQNTKGVGPVLTKYNLPYIPEAHCYLVYQGHRFDFTRHDNHSAEPISEFLYEKVIQPKDIGEKKIKIHKDFLKQHFHNRSLNEIWQAREECIEALSK